MSGSVQRNLAVDGRSLNDLMRQAQKDPKQAAQQSARQFEAMFANMLIAQMRKTSFVGDDELAKALTGNNNDVWRSMYDQQLAQSLAGLDRQRNGELPSKTGLGLADVIEKQLLGTNIPQRPKVPFQDKQTVTVDTKDLVERNYRSNPKGLSVSTLDYARRSMPSTESPSLAIEQMLSTGQVPRRIQNGKFRDPSSGQYTVNPGTSIRSSETGPINAYRQLSLDDSDLTPKQKDFIQRFAGSAKKAESVTGIPAHFILGQAALESGWGKREIKHGDGQTSHNLFGIKATGWKGKVANTMTREVFNGKEQRMKQGFRAYESYDDAFVDYAQLIANNSRYTKVANAKTAHEFAHGLQNAGYATDPEYAKKLLQVIQTTSKVKL